MPKPKRTVRPTYLNLAVPENIRAVLDLRLYSELEGRVPHGAYSQYICALIMKDLFPGEANEALIDNAMPHADDDFTRSSQDL